MTRGRHNDQLTAAREAHGWTQTDLASHINAAFAQSSEWPNVVCHTQRVQCWEQGDTWWPQRRYRWALEAVFGCRVTELGFIPDHAAKEEDDMERRAFLGTVALAAVAPLTPGGLATGLSTYRNRVPGQGYTVDTDGILQQARRWETADWHGLYDPQLVHDEAVVLLQRLDTRQLSARARPAAYTAAAQALQVAGWMQVDSGRHRDGRELLARAVAAATAAGDPHVRATALSDLARQAAILGRGAEALAYLAYTDTDAAAYTPGLRSMLAAVRTRASAAAGDWAAVDRAAGLAYDEYTRIDPAGEPAYLGYYLDPAEVLADTGHARRVAAVKAGRGFTAAGDVLQRAAGLFDGSFTRSRALAWAGVAEMRFADGELDAAVAAGQQLVQVVAARRVRSQRVAAGLRLVGQRASAAPVAGAAELHRAVNQLVRTVAA